MSISSFASVHAGQAPGKARDWRIHDQQVQPTTFRLSGCRHDL